MADALDDLYDAIALRLRKVGVVPVLGAGANLCGRPEMVPFERGGRYLPSGAELARVLANDVDFRFGDDSNLARVSQYVSVIFGDGAIFEYLHDVFDVDYPPTALHQFLARLSRQTREAGAHRCMLLLTTNYDDMLERAFQAEGEPYDLLTYIADDGSRDLGLFRHEPFEGEATVIRVPNEYDEIPLDRRAVIAKIHGAVERHSGGDDDRYVITEEHYVDYLSRASFSGLFPKALATRLKYSHLLFLGHSLRDWNLRVMLYRLWREREGGKFTSWAVQADPDPIDSAVWDKRELNILPVRVEDFVAAMEQRFATAETGTL